MVSGDRKHATVEHCKDMLQSAQNDTNVKKSIVTGDETWCFQYEPLTKQQSAAWLSPKKPKLKKVHMQNSRVKTLLYSSIPKEFLPESQTVNSDYYLGDLNHLWARILRNST
jgi:hypothetical protein